LLYSLVLYCRVALFPGAVVQVNRTVGVVSMGGV
jgi:hypothetical protein